MTVKELLDTVKCLIGEYDYFDNDEFSAAANTALGTIYSEARFVGRASVYLSSPKILLHKPILRHKANETETIQLIGKAYSMRLFGKGTVIINDGQSSVNHSFNGWGTVLRGMISRGGTIKLTGSLAYTVKDAVMFAECESENAEEIPVFGKTRSIKISSFVGDFSRALSFPTDEHGRPLSNVVIENGCIVCPRDFSGEVCFSYKKRPPRISKDAPDIEIPISKDAEGALALLTAAYMLGESESEAAEFFIKEYKRALCSAADENLPSSGGAYFDTTGWA